MKRIFIPPSDPPQMVDGMFYNLIPPANVNGELYDHVQCEYRVPNHPDRYIVKGIPRGQLDKKSFILRFSSIGRVRPILSEIQNEV
jgi:hypothetical protein